MGIFRCKLCFILLLVLGICNKAQANQPLIDSLEQLLSVTEGEQKTKLLGDLSWEYRFVDPEKAAKYAQQEIKIAIAQNNQKYIAQGYNDLGILLTDFGQYDTALYCYQTALQIRNKFNDIEGIAALNNKIGIVYQLMGNFNEALEHSLKALKIYETINDTPYMTYAMNNVATLHFEQGNYEKSLELQKKTLVIREKLNDRKGMAYSFMNIGNIQSRLGNPEKSMEYYEKALALAREVNDVYAMHNILHNMGLYYTATDQLQKGIETLTEALEIRRQLKNLRGVTASLSSLAEVNVKAENYVLAISQAREAIKLAEQINSDNEKEYGYLFLAKAFEGTGKFDSAYHYQQKYAIIRDSLRSDEINEKIADMQTRYETNKKEQKIELLNSENELKELSIESQNRKMFVGALGGGIILLLLGFVLYRNKQREKQKLQQEKIAHQKELLEATMKTQEEERQRIAKELHDGISQQLSSLKMGWQKITADQQQENNLKKLTSILDETCEDVRTISHQMMPRSLEQSGLTGAIGDMLEKSFSQTKVKISFFEKIHGQRFAQEIETGFYRIAQELTNNILKHAQAAEVEVQLYTARQNLLLVVSDNGKGFDIAKTKNVGLGLINIQSRIEMLNGSVAIESTKGNGTVTTIKAPMK